VYAETLACQQCGDLVEFVGGMNESPMRSVSAATARYGASIAAVQFSQMPSCMTLTVRAVNRE
jgi:predicted nucleic acid-binding Zn ribbon protein